jgi:hypothetical protein
MDQPNRRRRRSPAVGLGLLAALSAAVFALAVPAGAEGPNAVQNLGGCTANTLPSGDDNSTDTAVPLGFTANFFGRSFSDVFVNQNGNVTFSTPLGQFTPSDFAVSTVPIVAAFWADVDTSPAQSGKVTYGQTTVDGQPAFCVNWINVGYYNNGVDKLNSFQLLLVSRGGNGNFDIVFNYDKVQWETGDASLGTAGLGGSSAAAGYSAGDQDPSHAFTVPGSFQNGALLDSNQTTGLIHGSRATPQLGRYVFEVRNKPAPPVIGKTVNIGVVSGTIRFREPGEKKFHVLGPSQSIPVGSSIDATNGTVRLFAAKKGGGTQKAVFFDGRFSAHQSKRSTLTNLRLEGGNPGACRGAARGGKGSSRVLRRLWGHGKGRTRTSGNNGSGTVRGTFWLTEDRCDGTFFRVKQGVVAVRDFTRHRTVVLHAGQHYLAPAP